MTLNELIEGLEALKDQGFGHVEVITDMSHTIIAVDYSKEDGDEAVVLDLEI